MTTYSIVLADGRVAEVDADESHRHRRRCPGAAARRSAATLTRGRAGTAYMALLLPGRHQPAATHTGHAAAGEAAPRDADPAAAARPVPPQRLMRHTGRVRAVLMCVQAHRCKSVVAATFASPDAAMAAAAEIPCGDQCDRLHVVAWRAEGDRIRTEFFDDQHVCSRARAFTLAYARPSFDPPLALWSRPAELNEPLRRDTMTPEMTPDEQLRAAQNRAVRDAPGYEQVGSAAAACHEDHDLAIERHGPLRSNAAKVGYRMSAKAMTDAAIAEMGDPGRAAGEVGDPFQLGFLRWSDVSSPPDDTDTD
jgi:hypothetical protein